jgi:2-polyprenyl-6-methoxyphenol hydroxylase-like FAD-dependent oxidoreductase
MSDKSIAIVGAGIAGLASAIALAKSGEQVSVYEQASEFSDIGAGLQLGPNAVRALQKLGCWEACQSTASEPPEIHIRDGVNGKVLRRIKLGNIFAERYGAPYRVAHRAQLHAALLDHAKSLPGVAVFPDHRVLDINNGHDDVYVNFENQTTQRHATLFAADGINSSIRHMLFPNTQARSMQLTAHRSLLPLIPKMDGIDFECVNLWLTQFGHVVHYPVGTPARLNIVAVIKQGSVANSFVRAGGLLQNFLWNVSDWQEWPIRHVPQLTTWSDARTCLIGDAAHGTAPFLAQGAAMALEDAASLATFWPSTKTYAEKFRIFERQRKARTEKLDQRSRSMVKSYHAGNLPRFVRNLVLQTAPDNVIEHRLRWLYDWSVN